MSADELHPLPALPLRSIRWPRGTSMAYRELAAGRDPHVVEARYSLPRGITLALCRLLARDERGSILATMAVCGFPALVLVGGVLAAGQHAMERQRDQGCVDSGAVAAAVAIQEGNDPVHAATAYSTANGCTAPTVSVGDGNVIVNLGEIHAKARFANGKIALIE